jgi:carotenoid cleavage dioxygenase
VKYDLQTGGYIAYSAGPRYFYNEPGFAPRDHARSEDDGYLVVPVWNPDERRSEIQVFDAHEARMTAGPIARIVLPRRMPHGFHATFVDQGTLDRWK